MSEMAEGKVGEDGCDLDGFEDQERTLDLPVS